MSSTRITSGGHGSIRVGKAPLHAARHLAAVKPPHGWT